MSDNGAKELAVVAEEVDKHLQNWADSDGKKAVVITFGIPYFKGNTKKVSKTMNAGESSSGADTSSSNITEFDGTGNMSLDAVLGKSIIISVHGVAQELNKNKRKAQEGKGKDKDDGKTHDD